LTLSERLAQFCLSLFGKLAYSEALQLGNRFHASFSIVMQWLAYCRYRRFCGTPTIERDLLFR
jgi:hypothetical protein